MKLLASYFLLEPSEDFLPTCKVAIYMRPATLPDIESEIYVHYFSKKKQSIWFKAIKSAVHVYNVSYYVILAKSISLQHEISLSMSSSVAGSITCFSTN